MKTKKSSEFGVRSSELNSTIRNPQSAIVSAGFTLLEVIISMAIIATALVALLSLQGRSTGMMDSAGKMEGARLLSERLMGEGELQGVPNGEKTGTEGIYNWRISEIKITPEVMPEGVKALPGRQLSLEVSWEEGKRVENLKFAEYIYER